MSGFSLPKLLAGLHDTIEHRLKLARETMGHPVNKGDASEAVWLDLLQTYLPRRYKAAKAHVVDSTGAFSEQIDVVVFDRQYSPLVFQHEGQTIIPAESVYAVFEAKQSIAAPEITYAHRKVASVRRLHRTSLPIPHAGGTYPPKPLSRILAGLLTLESAWNPPLGQTLIDNLCAGDDDSRLDLGCGAAHGVFACDQAGVYWIRPQGKAATAFLFELIARLQETATVSMIDIRAYARWLTAAPEQPST
jgi:hypothetical protein